MANPQPIDYAILGGGGAGLSLLCHLHWAGALENKQVLIVEPAKKQQHDRTWSFWESGEGPFEHLVKHRWPSVGVHNLQKQSAYHMAPLAYKVIHSPDFYDYCQDLIDRLPNVHILPERAEQIVAHQDQVSFSAAGQPYSAQWAFSSLPHPLRAEAVQVPYLDQHFRGWFIETEQPAFDPQHATIMDFRTPQLGETRFLYVLPTSPTEALVEVAIFSNQHLPAADYDQIITHYLHDHWQITGLGLKQEGYKSIKAIQHTEQGVIPMTTYPYPKQNGRLIHIGLAGGYARPSTGFTFHNMQRHFAQLAQQLAQGEENLQAPQPWPSRHLAYDATILSILQKQELAGEQIFPLLFANNPPERVLRFLDGKTSLLEEVQLMATTPMLTFGKAFVRELWVSLQTKKP